MSRLTDGVQRTVLANGMTLLVRESHATPLVAVCLVIRGGAWGETEATCGLSHLLQRTLLKGTRRHSGSDLAFELESHGISLTPFTGKDMVGVSMGVIARHFETGLDLLQDIAWSPSLPPEAVEREQRNILQEIQRKQDDPLGWSLEMCEAAMFPGHPYGFPLAGRPEAISALTVAHLREWHAGLYGRPEHTFVSVVGDMPAEKVVSQWESRLATAGMKRAEAQAPTTQTSGPAMVQQRNDKQQAAITVGYATPGVTSADHAAFDVLNHLLAGMGSRLFVELRDRQGLAYVVSSGYDARILAGSFRCYLATRPDQQEAALAALRRELERLRETPPPPVELHRAVEYMRGLHAISLQRNTAQASRFATYEAAGVGYQAVDRQIEALLAVRPEDIQRCAQRYLDPQYEAVAIVSPLVPAPVPA